MFGRLLNFGRSARKPYKNRQGQHYNLKVEKQFGDSEMDAKYWYEHAKFVLSRVSLSGLHIECGVYQGNSLSFLAAQKPDIIWHGFDSFEGLQEEWDGHKVGHLDLGGEIPVGGCDYIGLSKFPDNIKFYMGFFEKTLPPFVSDHQQEKIAFLHIDSDLYSSAKTILDCFGPMFEQHTIIMFDDYITDDSKGEEAEAFMEFIYLSGFGFKYLSRHHTGGTSVAVELL